MKMTLKTLALGALFFAQAAYAQTLVDTWSYSGGGLDPATYSGTFRPNPLTPDTGSTGGGTISVSGMGGSGGLGSNGVPAGYGGYYTFFNTNASFTMQTTTILAGLDTITFSLLIGGGDPTLITFAQGTVTLNYNGSNPAVVSSGFNVGTSIVLSTPIGPQTVTPYTWTWTNLSALGATTGFSTAWNTQGATPQANNHIFIGEVSATQAIPEPTAVVLIALGGAALTLRRRSRLKGVL